MSYSLYVDETVGTYPDPKAETSWILCRNIEDCKAVWLAHEPAFVSFKQDDLGHKFAKWLTERNKIDETFEYNIRYKNTLDKRTVEFVLNNYINYINFKKTIDKANQV